MSVPRSGLAVKRPGLALPPGTLAWYSVSRRVSAITRTRSPYRRLERTSRVFLALVLASAVAVFALVTLGGVVRVTGSGLGCPDWPLCHGRLIPPLEFHTLIEYSHRLVASLVGGLVALTTIVAWRWYRHQRWVVAPLTLALLLVGVAALLGRQAVLTELSPTIVTVHLATAEALFALLLITAVWSWRPAVHESLSELQVYGSDSPGGASRPVDRSVFPWALGAALATYLVLLSGSYVVGRGAGAVCPSWPLCDGGLFPSFELQWVHMAHRVLAGGGGLLVAWVALRSWRRRGDSVAIGYASILVGVALVTQTLAGAANPWFRFVPAAQAVHLSLATVLWGSLALLAVLAWRPPEPEPVSASAGGTPRGRQAREVIADYITLTKPRILLLLLVTALGGMFLAAQGLPPLPTMALVLVGGSLGAGGASALNHYLDRHFDARMYRTRHRPVAGQRIKPRDALAFGVVLNVLAFALLATWVNLLSAVLTLSATLFYVFVYTRWLKPTTPQSIVIGGAAGAMPPLVGWAAVTGGLDLPALYLFAIVFFWTPPHFWALSLLLRGDYARAGVPMLPVVSGVATTARSIMLHTVVLVAITALFFTSEAVGWLYLLGAVGLGSLFLLMAWRLLRSGGVRGARPLYLYSLMYLFGIFGFVMVDSTLAL